MIAVISPQPTVGSFCRRSEMLQWVTRPNKTKAMKTRTMAFEHDGHPISYREAQVLLCYAKGMTACQTADLLCVSYSTVKTHREHIRLRFDLHGHNELMCFAIKWMPELEKSVELPTKIGSSTD